MNQEHGVNSDRVLLVRQKNLIQELNVQNYSAAAPPAVRFWNVLDTNPKKCEIRARITSLT